MRPAARDRDQEDERERRALLVVALLAAFAAGVVAALLWMHAHPPVAAAPPPCPDCPACPQPAAAAPRAAVVPPRRPKAKRAARPGPEALPGQDEPPSDDAARLRRWMEAQAEALRECGRPETRGRAVLALDLAADGRVRKAQLYASESVAADSEQCILERARGWRAPVHVENRLLVNLSL
jgi:hypothetical protein